ncbi:two-component sensor histidine kinase [Oxalobacteraceae bacterium OM1]|nr:two-component sensor histidine kinase [Oxalobacteraceae bacterium OM1]
MNRIFLRIFPLTLLAIAAAALVVYGAIRLFLGDPLEDIARKQASGPIFLLEHYIDQAPQDEWLARLNRVREISNLSLELVPVDTAVAALPEDKRDALRRGELVLDIPGRAFLRRVDLKGERYVGSDEEVLQVLNLPIDVGLELKIEAIRYGIVALFLLVPIAYWSRMHWRELLALSKAADAFGEGRLDVRAQVRNGAAVYPLAQRMNQMAERIDSLMSAQRQLLHSVSHELRTPIARLEFALELLADRMQGAPEEKRVRAMEEDVVELKELVNELLSLTRLGQAEQAAAEPVAVVPLLQSCAKRHEHVLASRRFQLIESVGDCDVAGDPRLLARAVGNLLANAAKYAHSAVELRAERGADGSIVITVDDDGPGIPEAERERVFEPFYRLDRSRDRSTGGFGLGLAIARKAAQLHAGTISVEESPLGGARFVLRLPASTHEVAYKAAYEAAYKAAGQKKSLPV